MFEAESSKRNRSCKSNIKKTIKETQSTVKTTNSKVAVEDDSISPV